MVNDTVGTMMTCAYEEPTCEVGLIVGGCPGRSFSATGKAGFSCFVGPESTSQCSVGGIVRLLALSPYTSGVALWTEAAGLSRGFPS